MNGSFRVSYRDNVTHVPNRLRIRANHLYKIYYYRSGADNIRLFVDGTLTELNPGEAVLIPEGSFDGKLKRSKARYARCVSYFPAELSELIRCADSDIAELLREPSVFTLTDEAIKEYDGIISSLSADACGAYSAELILRQLRILSQCKRRSLGKTSREGLVGMIMSAISEECLMPDAADRIAARLGYSKNHISKHFKEKMSIGLHDFIIAKRLLAALNMLSSGKSVTEAAYACGFSSTSHFISVFRSHYGDTPKQYTQKIIKI